MEGRKCRKEFFTMRNSSVADPDVECDQVPGRAQGMAGPLCLCGYAARRQYTIQAVQ